MLMSKTGLSYAATLASAYWAPRRLLVGVAAMVALAASGRAEALIININPGSGLSARR
jgi:hypothetical protein